MAFTTIESSELVDKGVSGLSDTPDIEASDLKERFDSLGKLAIQKFQTHINELEANTASGSIGANVPAGLNASANVQSLIDALYLIIKDLKEYKHNHSNRDVLELITADVKESYDRLATIFNTISEVENVVTDNASKIPTSAAIVKLTQDIYANKNAEAVQAVEAAQAAQTETESVAADLREYAEAVHNAISNLGRTADDTLREATRTAERVQSAMSTAESSVNDAKNYAEQAQEAWERISNSGSTGVPGENGKSAYELAVDNGYTGTLAEWLNSLKGSDGKDGKDGAKGDKGDKGDTGERGAQGIQGVQGEKGDKGDTGAQGLKGDSGVEQQIVIDSAVTSYAIKPNILYVFPELAQLDVSFDLTDYNPNIVNDFHFQFTNGSTPCELNLPENVNIGDYEPQPNGICEISIVNGLMSYQNWSTEE
jgi:hypothetical protein